jgi:hypothetical protein
MGAKATGDVLEREEMKSVALKRKAVANGDKVRYRVYRAPDDYVAVIAENALMAMKLTKISNPHRIIRDLPLAGVSVEKELLVTHHMQPTVFIRPDMPMVEAKPTHFETAAVVDEEFVPLSMQSMHTKNTRGDSLIDAETLLNSLKVPDATTPEAAPVPEIASPPAFMVEPEPVMEPIPEPQVEIAPEAVPQAPVATTEDAKDVEVLSEEEVQRLLSS